MEAYRCVRCRGSYNIQTIYSQMTLRLSVLGAHRALPQRDFLVRISVGGGIDSPEEIHFVSPNYSYDGLLLRDMVKLTYVL
jgi:hypothetical protein